VQTLYYYDNDFYFSHSETGTALDPTNSTDQEPTFSPGNKLKWNGEAWEYEAIPVPPEPEPTTADRIAALEAGLTELDLRSTRALRAIATGTDVQDDHDKLDQFESVAQDLRTQLQELLTEN
jgi:hypothetical protein